MMKNINCEKKVKYNRKGILYFCGVPSSYVKYQLFNRGAINKIPSISEARKSKKGVARCPNSFKPSLFYLKKRIVYSATFYFDKHDHLVKIKIKGVKIKGEKGDKSKTFYYYPLI